MSTKDSKLQPSVNYMVSSCPYITVEWVCQRASSIVYFVSVFVFPGLYVAQLRSNGAMFHTDFSHASDPFHLSSLCVLFGKFALSRFMITERLVANCNYVFRVRNPKKAYPLETCEPFVWQQVTPGILSGPTLCRCRFKRPNAIRRM